MAIKMNVGMEGAAQPQRTGYGPAVQEPRPPRPAPELIEVSEPEQEVLRTKVDNSRRELEILRENREKWRKAYFREPLGNEREGRSKVVDSMVYNHVESTMPHLCKQFLATDHKIAITGPDMKMARALKMVVREAINDQGGFRLVNDVIKDGLIYGNGTAKVWWSRLWGPSEERELNNLREEDVIKLSRDPRFMLHEIIETPAPMAEIDDQIPDPRTGRSTVFQIQGVPTYSVRLTFTPLLESGPVIAPMPPEEFISERGKVRINDRKGVGHRTVMEAGVLLRENERLSRPGQPYYTNLEEAIHRGMPGSGLEREDDERRGREEVSFNPTSFTDGGPTMSGGFSQSDLRKMCEVIEWSDYVVVGGEVETPAQELAEGEVPPEKPEPTEQRMIAATVTLCNGVVIRAESNEDGIIPICTWSPIVNPHSIYGQSLAWLHADDQNMRTCLYRALLDSIVLSIDKPWVVRNRSVDMLALQNLQPGTVIFGDPDDIKPLDIDPVDTRIVNVMELIKGEGEERGPGTRYNQGSDANSLNKTATGISLIQRASMNKIELIAMAFGELFLVDLYNKMIFLFQQNLDIPRDVTVDGERMVISRELIQGDYRAHADLGLQVDYDDREFAKSMTLAKAAVQVSVRYPMLFPLQVMYEHFKNVYIAAGIKDVNKLILPPPEKLRGWFPGAGKIGAGTAPPGQRPAQPGARPGMPQPPPMSVMAGGARRATSAPDGVGGNATAQPDETRVMQ